MWGPIAYLGLIAFALGVVEGARCLYRRGVGVRGDRR